MGRSLPPVQRTIPVRRPWLSNGKIKKTVSLQMGDLAVVKDGKGHAGNFGDGHEMRYRRVDFPRRNGAALEGFYLGLLRSGRNRAKKSHEDVLPKFSGHSDSPVIRTQVAGGKDICRGCSRTS